MREDIEPVSKEVYKFCEELAESLERNTYDEVYRGIATRLNVSRQQAKDLLLAAQEYLGAYDLIKYRGRILRDYIPR